MDNTIPKFDLPENWLAGTDISKELLGLYKNYPMTRLKFCLTRYIPHWESPKYHYRTKGL